MEKLDQNYSITYQNDLQHSYMVVEAKPVEEIIEYQIRIMQENPTLQLLSMQKKQIDDKVCFFYNITSKITVEQLLKRKRFSKHEFLSIIKSLLAALKISNSYLLHGGSFILDNEFIYVDPASLQISIAYIPTKGIQDLSKAIRAWMMDLTVYRISFTSSLEGDFVYQLLNFIKSEDFGFVNLERMLDTLAVQQASEIQNTGTKGLMGSFEAKSNGDQAINEEYRKGTFIALGLQIFFAALAGLLIKLLMSSSDAGVDMTKLASVLIIIAGLDFLTLRKLKLFRKVSEKTGFHKASLLKPMEEKKESKVKPGRKKVREYNKEAAAVEANKYFNPKELETNLLAGTHRSAPYLVSLGDSFNETIYIEKTSFIYGRLKQQSDYVSSNRAVGKLHAEIINKAGVFYLKDLNSRNGTYINGERVVSNVEYTLKNNDKISFANSDYKFVCS